MQLDPHDAVLAGDANRVPARERTLHEPAHSSHLASRIGGIPREDVGGDRRLASHTLDRTAVLSTSSVASGRAAKRKGTNVVPSPGETCITAASVRYAPHG